MKKQILGLLFATACIGLTPLSAQAQVNHVTIMPFGDSVTARGSDPESSYRYWLWTDLQTGKFQNFDFIGHQNGVSDGTPANSWPDEEYEGGDGLESSDAVELAPGAASLNPDIVLLDFGSNDILDDNFSLDQTISNLDQVIQIFAAQNPDIIILIAKPTQFAVDPSSSRAEQRLQKRNQSKLASSIARLARTERRAGIDVVAINLFGGFNPRKDTVDGSHPNVRGEQLIAKRYFAELRRLLKKM